MHALTNLLVALAPLVAGLIVLRQVTEGIAP